MKKTKWIFMLTAMAVLCLCLCLTGCGKKKETVSEQETYNITADDANTADQKDQNAGANDPAKDATPGTTAGNNPAAVAKPGTAADDGSAQKPKQVQPNISYTGDGSGVEKIDASQSSPKAAPSQSSGKSSQSAAPSQNSAKPTQSGTTSQSTTPSQGNQKNPQAPQYQQGTEPVYEPTTPGGQTQPAGPSTPAEPTQPLSSLAREYADYCAMDAEGQYNYYKSFASAEAFMNWYNAAKEAYETENPATVLEPGAAIDLGGN